MTPKEKRTEVKESNLWKDYFDRKRVRKFADSINEAEPLFDTKKYQKEVYKADFEQMELKERINHLALCLKPLLSSDYKKATNVLIKIAPKLPEFENWVLTAYIEKFGVDLFSDSVVAMKELTKYGTAEFAIRPFMIYHTQKMLDLFKTWVSDPNEHIRRLVAEATRPRGVWVAYIKEFQKNPKPVIKLLDQLNSDSSLYVRKAVANNLNDISKDNPDLVVQTCKRWNKNASKETSWIIKHGCRSLIKQGHSEILSLLGFTVAPKIEIKSFSIEPRKINMGEKLAISLDVLSKGQSDQKLVIDYKMHFLKKNGKQTTKVFKWTEKKIEKSESIKIKASYTFRDLSTRKHYPGKHNVELLINGQIIKNSEFQLIK